MIMMGKSIRQIWVNILRSTCTCISFFPLGLVGLAISYALSVTNLLSGVVNSFTETEKQMVSVERAQQYIDNVPSEHADGMLMVRSIALLGKGTVNLEIFVILLFGIFSFFKIHFVLVST